MDRWINFAFHRRGISITFPLGLGRRDRSRWCRNQPGRVKCLSLSSILCPFLRRPALRGGEALLHVPLATFAVYAGAFNTAHATLPIYKYHFPLKEVCVDNFDPFWPEAILGQNSLRGHFATKFAHSVRQSVQNATLFNRKKNTFCKWCSFSVLWPVLRFRPILNMLLTTYGNGIPAMQLLLRVPQWYCYGPLVRSIN